MKFFVVLSLSILLFACNNSDNFIPKPPTYLRLDIPEYKYIRFQDDCPYTFETSSLFTINNAAGASCHKDIDLGPLNGDMFFSYIQVEEPIARYINYAVDKVDEHKIKATSIIDTQYIFPEKKVYGTFFELQGDVASPFQFYLTDSTDRFISGVVYLNAVPNYDSLKPTIGQLKKDLTHLIETFEWK